MRNTLPRAQNRAFRTPTTSDSRDSRQERRFDLERLSSSHVKRRRRSKRRSLPKRACRRCQSSLQPIAVHDVGRATQAEQGRAHEELGPWALTVNPFDVAGQADAIHRALEMPAEERRERIDAIRSWVREHDLFAWIEVQLQALDAESLQSPV